MKLKNSTRTKGATYLLNKDLFLNDKISQSLHHSWPHQQFNFSRHRGEFPVILVPKKTWRRVLKTVKYYPVETQTQHQEE